MHRWVFTYVNLFKCHGTAIIVQRYQTFELRSVDFICFSFCRCSSEQKLRLHNECKLWICKQYKSYKNLTFFCIINKRSIKSSFLSARCNSFIYCFIVHHMWDNCVECSIDEGLVWICIMLPIVKYIKYIWYHKIYISLDHVSAL